MKIRTDFVTNSSSSGYVIINIKLVNGKKLELVDCYDSGNGGLLWNHISESEFVNTMKQVGSVSELAEGITKCISEGFFLDEKCKKYKESIYRIEDFSSIKSISMLEETTYDEGPSNSCNYEYFFNTDGMIPKPEPIKYYFSDQFEYRRTVSIAGGTMVKDIPNEEVDILDLSLDEALKSWDVELAKNGKSYEVKNYKSKSNKMIVPRTIDGIIVKKFAPKIKNPSFIEEITIPDSIASVPAGTFPSYVNLKCITIAKKTIFREKAFSKCAKLYDKNQNFTIGGMLFDVKPSDNMVISGEVKTIPGEFFDYDHDSIYHVKTYKTRQMKTLYIEDGVENIENSCFSHQKRLEAIRIPKSVKKIRINSFSFCEKLSHVDIPSDSKVEFGQGAFCMCNRLYNKEGLIIIQGNLLDYVFLGSNKNIVVPEDVTAIGSSRFKGAPIETFVMNKPVTIIKETFGAPLYDGLLTFAKCSNLKKVILPESFSDLSDQAFANCSSMADNDGNVIYRGILYDWFGVDDTMKIPREVKEISKQPLKFSFQYYERCEKLKKIYYPSELDMEWVKEVRPDIELIMY